MREKERERLENQREIERGGEQQGVREIDIAKGTESVFLCVCEKARVTGGTERLSEIEIEGESVLAREQEIKSPIFAHSPKCCSVLHTPQA